MKFPDWNDSDPTATLKCMNPLSDQYPGRATHWKLRSQTLDFGPRPLLMGIVNTTPDSFSDGGKYFDADSAIAHALQLVEDGADLIDIGGESTRPYASSISTDEEIRRILPVIESLAQQTNVPISIDTSKSKVAQAAIAAGAEIINDISALEFDTAMLDVALETQAGICAMHMQGTPQTMQDNPQYNSVVDDIYKYLEQKLDTLQSAGVSQEQLCLDPGIGFGKTHAHNLELMTQWGRFHGLECPILVGHSRKGFLAKLLEDKQADRTSVSVGAALALASQGVQILRIHDVRPTREALLAFMASGGVS